MQIEMHATEILQVFKTLMLPQGDGIHFMKLISHYDG